MAIINGEHNYIELWQKKLVHMLFNILMLAITKLKMSNIHPNGSTFTLISAKGSIEINLPYLGEHNVKNAAATALAMNVGASLADVKAGLEHRSQVKGVYSRFK